jgi:hypothetical protein
MCGVTYLPFCYTYKKDISVLVPWDGLFRLHLKFTGAFPTSLFLKFLKDTRTNQFSKPEFTTILLKTFYVRRNKFQCNLF